MKPRLVVFLLSFCWGFASVTAQAAPRAFRDAGVSLTYDDAVLKKPQAHRVKALPLALPTDIPEGVAPTHVEVQFGKGEGQLWVFATGDPKVKDFRAAYPPHATAQKQLRTLLRERPAESKEMPVLPWADVGQPFNKKIRYLAFHNGSGVAWLTQWTIESTPLNNAQLWYVFQGLTQDGVHYVAAQFHIAHPSLPATAQVKDWPAFEKRYPAYLAKATREIAAQPDDSFQPPLSKLRAMFNSIEVIPAR